MCTPRQGMAIFFATGFDVRPLKLTTEQASDIIATQNVDLAVNMITQFAQHKGITLTRKNEGKGFKSTDKDKFDKIWNEAHEAGMEAGNAKKPTPMVVQQHANPLDDNSPVIQQWAAPSGPCGFAWVIVRPGTSAFARWATKNKGATAHYYGGTQVKWVSEFNQSIEQKMAYAAAFANVLNKHGITAYAQDRMD